MVNFCFLLVLVEFIQHFIVRLALGILCGDQVQTLRRQLPKVISCIVKPASDSETCVSEDKTQ